MGTKYDETLRRYVADCESHPDHADVPAASHRHEFFLRRDLDTGQPKEAVVWAIWMGGFKELATWPWTADGLAEAQAWCDEHSADWKDGHAPVRPGSLAVHANAV